MENQQPLFDIQKLWDQLGYDPAHPLLFNTGLFLVLFILFMGVYYLASRYRKAKMVAVILFSLYFYYKSSPEGCFILLGVCVFDYLLGNLMDRAGRRWQLRLMVLLNILVNVGMLIYFKYFNLLISTFNSIASTDFDVLNLILPAGLSFFTFRSISYIVDIYRGEIKPCKSFLNYIFFLTFFPPLLAGPVVRAKDMLPQIAANNPVTRAMVSEGLFLIVAGLIKKVVVADFISDNFVDRVFDNPALYSGFENMVAIYGFCIQIYCDFSGYSDMAIGIALLLGFRFKDNFRSPYKSQNPTEFWHRWHISLSSWLRDYVYIPLGGSRSKHFKKLRTHTNLITTMLIGGLWHGASWMYLLWGLVNGVLLSGHKLLRGWLPRVPEHKRDQWWRVAGNIFITFNLVAICMLFFRARSLEHVGDMATQIFTNFHWAVIPSFVNEYIIIVMVILLGYAMHFAPVRWTNGLRERLERTPLVLQAVILALVLFLIIQVRSSDIVPFIYLQY